MAEYGSMFLVSGLATILFFGGWHGPIPIFGADILGWAYAPGATEWAFTGYLANLAGCINFILKAVVGVTVMIWVRWTFPRLRIDQVITTCLKYCVPIAAVCFLGALVWAALDIASPNDLDLMSSQPKSTVRENWVIPTRKLSSEAEANSEKPAPATTKKQQETTSNKSIASSSRDSRKPRQPGGDL